MEALCLTQRPVLKPKADGDFLPPAMPERSRHQHSTRRKQVRQFADPGEVSREPMHIRPETMRMDQADVSRLHLPPEIWGSAKATPTTRRSLHHPNS